jgi:hypothetical protein
MPKRARLQSLRAYTTLTLYGNHVRGCLFLNVSGMLVSRAQARRSPNSRTAFIALSQRTHPVCLQCSQVDFWKNSKQLGHGTLIALWHEPRTADDPQIIFATVSDRDARKLAGQFSEPSSGPNGSSSTVRSKLGITLQDPRGTELLVQACVGEGQLASRSAGREVVLLQASGSFFAVEPMLRALQRLVVLPFSQYLVPALAQQGERPAGESNGGLAICTCPRDDDG